MKTNFTYSVLLAGLMMAACSNEETAIDTTEEQTPASVVAVTATMPFVPETRMDFKEETKTDDNGSEVKQLALTWQSTDKISIMQGSTGAPVDFSQNGEISTTEAGKSKTYFAGTMSISYASTKFHSVYPPTTSPNATSISLDMTGQKGTLDEKKLYMYDSDKEIVDNNLNFDFKHLTSILKLTLTPTRDVNLTISGEAGAPTTTRAETSTTPTKLTSIFISGTGVKSKATVDITATSIEYVGDDSRITLDNGETGFPLTEGKATVYLHFLPDSEIETLRIEAVDDLGDIYVGTITKSNTLIAGTMYEKSVDVKYCPIGYMMLKDGTLKSPYKYDATTATGDGVAIGVVAYLYNSDDTSDRRVTLPNGNKATGIVLALSDVKNPNAAEGTTDEEEIYGNLQWRTSNTAVYPDRTENDYPASISEAVNSTTENGYTLTNYIINPTEGSGISTDDFPAFKAIKQYDVTAPTGTSGWFMPSIGEWRDILGLNGLGLLPTADYVDSYTSKKYYQYDNTIKIAIEDKETGISTIVSAGAICSAVAKNVNYYLGKAGVNVSDDNPEPGAFKVGECYWASSDYSETKAYDLYFFTGHLSFSRKEKDTPNTLTRVRPILAF